MIAFGLASTALNLATFAVLRRGCHAPPELFRTGPLGLAPLPGLVPAAIAASTAGYVLANEVAKLMRDARPGG